MQMAPIFVFFQNFSRDNNNIKFAVFKLLMLALTVVIVISELCQLKLLLCEDAIAAALTIVLVWNMLLSNRPDGLSNSQIQMFLNGSMFDRFV